MKKLAKTSSGRVICDLSSAEFAGLAKTASPDDIADGASVSLAWIQTMLQRMTDARLDAIILSCDALSDAATDIKGP
ncbi:MAG: hypothetical protein ACXABY_13925 [Candidatus Thorarchaeota archaeon]|jgi:hypothetical protein